MQYSESESESHCDVHHLFKVRVIAKYIMPYLSEPRTHVLFEWMLNDSKSDWALHLQTLEWNCSVTVTCYFSSVLFTVPFFSMSQIMRHHGCRSHMRDCNKLTGQEERLDLVVDSNDVILERVVWAFYLIQKNFMKQVFFFQAHQALVSGFQGILLDEADGVNRSQQPVMPAGFQPPKIVVSSWNRKVD